MAAVPLRRRLFLLAAVGIAPLVVVAGVGLYALAQQQRAQAERIGLELARALATAVDGELRSSASALQALATDAALERHDLVAFRGRAEPVPKPVDPGEFTTIIASLAARPPHAGG